MNYQKIYDSLVNYRLQNPAKLEFDYTENHHIIPRSLDKSLEKDKSNIVNLSAREHFIAHALLVKIYKQNGDKDKWYRMMCAFDAMSKLYGSIRNPELRYKNKSNSKLYEIWKAELSKYIKESGCRTGKNSSMHGKTFYYNPDTKEIKCFKIDEPVVGNWIKGLPSWIENKGTTGTVWVHNTITNKQKCISKNIIESFLNNNPNYKIRNVTISKNTYTIL
jgi:hypothetical protein